MNIIILDDNLAVCEFVSKIIEEHITFSYNLMIYTKYDKKLKEYIDNNNSPTIYILDITINQRDKDGLGIAKEIRRKKSRKHRVIFLSEHSEKAIAAIRYQIDPVDFIWKQEKKCAGLLVKAINKARKEILSVLDYDESRYINIYDNYKPFRISIDDIIFFKKIGEKKLVVYVDNDGNLKEYNVSKTIKAFKKELGNNFFYLSKSIIINLKYVGTIQPEEGIVKMKNGLSLNGANNNLKELIRCKALE